MFKTDDFNEISALHKAMLEAKFNVVHVNDDVVGNPIIADLSNRIYDELSRLQAKKLKSSDAELADWRRIKTNGSYRGFWRSAIINARRDPMFETADDSSKRSLAKCYLSPFTCTESEIDEFISEVAMTSPKKTLKQLTGSTSLKGAKLMKLSSIDEETVKLCLWLPTSRKACDIFFSGVKKLSVSNSGKGGNLMPAELVKYSVSSSAEESFEGTFTVGDSKKTVEIKADRVDCWI